MSNKLAIRTKNRAILASESPTIRVRMGTQPAQVGGEFFEASTKRKDGRFEKESIYEVPPTTAKRLTSIGIGAEVIGEVKAEKADKAEKK